MKKNKTSLSDKFSAFASIIDTLKPTDLHDCANNKAQVGGSIAA